MSMKFMQAAKLIFDEPLITASGTVSKFMRRTVSGHSMYYKLETRSVYCKSMSTHAIIVL